MSKCVGILMKHEQGHGVFLTADGRFIKGRARVIGAELGQELEFVPVRPRTAEWFRYGMVAVLLLAVMISGISVYLTRPVIAAYVTIDINPSVELGIDRNEMVRSVTALNSEAEKLTAGVDLLGLHVTEALEVLMTNAAQEGYLGPEGEHLVVITATTVAGNQTNPDELTNALDNRARAIVAGQEQTVVTAMVAAPEVREEAIKQGLSVGKLMVAQKAEASGIHLDPQELKGASNLSQSIRAAGGDPSVILKKDADKTQATTKAGESKSNSKQDTSKPAKGNTKDNTNSNSKGNTNSNSKNNSSSNSKNNSSNSSKSPNSNSKGIFDGFIKGSSNKNTNNSPSSKANSNNKDAGKDKDRARDDDRNSTKNQGKNGKSSAPGQSKR